jgi:hypothetical protein
VLYADIAPPIFPGYSLSPFDTKSLRMKSEKIDFYYGETCKIEAIFEVLNPTTEIVEKKIGFPFNPSAMRPWGQDTSKIYDFTMSLNGVNQVVTDRPRGREIRSDTKYWYGWTCKFKPGLNSIKLTYHTKTSFGNSGYSWEKTLYYVINSDKNWPGQIDNVQVTMHFPESIAQRQILAETSPKGYDIKGNEVRWQFTSFTPNPESNIELHFIDFKYFTDITKYEKVLSAPDTDNATKLKAAIFFASLAPYKGIDMSAPTYFTRSYYDEKVLPNLKSLERALFDSTYALQNGTSGNNDYYSVIGDRDFYKNDSVRARVKEVMNRIGYYENIMYPVIYKYITGANKLFREVVVRDPKNATAWAAYLNNYYLLETDAYAPFNKWRRSQCDCPLSQKTLVSEAFRNCENDSTIAIWHRFLFPEQPPFPDILEIQLYDPPQENVTIKIKYEDHSWGHRVLSPEELSIVKKSYTMSKNGYFVNNHMHLDEGTQKKLVDILGGCSLYETSFYREIRKYYKRGN